MTKKRDLRGNKSFSLPVDVLDRVNKEENSSNFITSLVREQIKLERSGELEYLKEKAIKHQNQHLKLKEAIFTLEWEEKMGEKLEKEKREFKKKLQKKMKEEDEELRRAYLIRKEFIFLFAGGNSEEKIKAQLSKKYSFEELEKVLNDTRFIKLIEGMKKNGRG